MTTFRKRAIGGFLFALLLAGDAIAQNAASPPPISLDDYSSKNGLKGQAGVQFVSLRCSAVYLFAAGMLRNDSPSMAEKYDAGAKGMMAIALGTQGATEEFVRDQIGRMASMYSDRARAAKANTGNVFDDALLRSDILFCKAISETLKQ